MKRTLSVLTLLVATSALVASMAFAQGSPAATPATPAAPAKTTATATKSEKKSMAKTPAMPVIDINSASKEDLMKLAGIGDVTADKIIAGRPYTSKSELVKKNVLTQDEMKKIEAHVMTKAAPKEATKK